MRNALLQVQAKLNAMPLHHLGAMLARVARERDNAKTESDRTIYTVLHKQVLFALSPQFDEGRQS